VSSSTAAVRAALNAPDARDPGIPVHRLVPVLADLRPEILERFAQLGFGPQVADDTLADIDRKVAIYGSPENSEVGIDPGWLLGLARADVIALGRLQFERLVGPRGRALHIPEDGPLDPAAVEESLARARELLGDEPLGCTSWVLDPLLSEFLGPGSRLVAFAERFDVQPAVRGIDADRAVAKFVFRRSPSTVLDGHDVHPRTRLERHVAAHLRSGAHWSEPFGRLRG